MGYYMSLQCSHFSIKEENKAAALKAVKEVDYQSWSRGDHSKAKTLDEAMSCLRWPIVEDDDGNVIDINFDGEKFGDDELLFKALGPYVEAGCYIQMSGEDNSMWRWAFDGNKCTEIYPTITW